MVGVSGGFTGIPTRLVGNFSHGCRTGPARMVFANPGPKRSKKSRGGSLEQNCAKQCELYRQLSGRVSSILKSPENIGLSTHGQSRPITDLCHLIRCCTAASALLPFVNHAEILMDQARPSGQNEHSLRVLEWLLSGIKQRAVRYVAYLHCHS